MSVDNIDLWAILGGLAIAYGIVFVLALVVSFGEAFADARRVEHIIEQREQELGRDLSEREVEELFDTEWQDEQAFRRLRNDGWFQAGMVVAATLADVLGGYYTALWADSAPMLNAAIMGAVQLPLGVWLDEPEIIPRPAYWASMLLIMPAVLFGAWICCGAA